MNTALPTAPAPIPHLGDSRHTMAQPPQPQRPKRAGPGPVKKGYLILYNAASAVAWLTVLGRVIGTLYVRDWNPAFVPIVADRFTRITQTFAVIEILHAIFGIVPAPVMTTVMQVASRLVLVWGITFPFPALAGSAWYSSMLCAWSLTEVMRYGYFALKQVDFVPYWLHWLRYSGFLILYPIGISSEVAMILKAVSGPASQVGPWYPAVLGAILLSYIPGSVILYSHMLKQRRKQLRGGAAKKDE
ncbi:tyrosine phosphatase-like protein [Diplogelasinospora grovesii]|uniref:Very-long-chain (3R)-3-hydroxyacyl-CoA dehydratase n=1 Tax=Diplogelasinospora grovesii TaxID=303347 RepID=A0AAN6N635_9PEZI|nr:tyrosine phosphatase-like protein [Diplogelasinospora grovesii]